MRKAASILGLVGAALFATTAHAAVTVAWIDRGVPQATDASGNLFSMNGYEAWILRVTTDSGKIAAYDFGGSNSGGITGNFSQINPGGLNADGPMIDNNSNPASEAYDGDSHFLGIASHFTAGILPFDDFASPGTNLYGSAPYSNNKIFQYGSSTYLKGALGVFGTFQSPTLDVAYLVVRNGSSISFTGAQVSTSSGTFVISSTNNPIFDIPEPASLLLLSIPFVFCRRRASR